jgi:hypothetical protein
MELQTLKPLCDTLHRYAGWLDRERPAVTVRADVHALEIAIEANADAMPLLEALDSSLARLPSGEVRKMLCVTSRKIRRALAESVEASSRNRIAVL